MYLIFMDYLGHLFNLILDKEKIRYLWNVDSICILIIILLAKLFKKLNSLVRIWTRIRVPSVNYVIYMFITYM